VFWFQNFWQENCLYKGGMKRKGKKGHTVINFVYIILYIPEGSKEKRILPLSFSLLRRERFARSLANPHLLEDIKKHLEYWDDTMSGCVYKKSLTLIFCFIYFLRHGIKGSP
jgi:hypothetical protein